VFKLHTGQVENPGVLTFMHDGYWYQGVDDTEPYYIRHPEPKPTNWPVLKMYGVSFGRRFVGVMRFAKPD
jgi:hypothetical protein